MNDSTTVEATSWHSYPSIYNIGHPAVSDLFDGPVVIEEKIDGSQFSFGLFAGEPKIRSKGQQMVWGAPEGMFDRAAATVHDLWQRGLLREGWTYRAEYLRTPKHNTLPYARIPPGHLIIFDVNHGHESYLPYVDKAAEAARLGLDIVPLIHEGCVTSADGLRLLLDRESCLGNVNIEGVVVKNYAKFGRDKKVLMGKYVSEAFKEIHGKEWKKSNPTHGDIVQELALALKTEARWRKALQSLRDTGALEHSPRDIPTLMKAVAVDLDKECEELVKERLFQWAWPKIKRGAMVGLPEWYKQHLIDEQFGEETT